MIDISTIKKDFPILSQKTVYLDSASSALTPTQVLDAERAFYENNYANVHRGNFKWSQLASEQYDQARDMVAEHFHVNSNEIVFTSGATASLNQLAETLCRELQPEENIVITNFEHHSNFIPWLEQAKRIGATVSIIDVKTDGTIDLSQARELINKKTKIVSFTAESNTVGTVLPIRELTELAHAQEAIVVVDGAQHAAHTAPNLRDLDVDFYVFSGHKMLGSTGIGGFFGKAELLEMLTPAHFGGGMVADFIDQDPTWKLNTEKWEPGTQNLAGAIGLAAAIKYLHAIGMDTVEAHVKELAHYAAEQLSKIDGVVVYGPKNKEERGGLVSFNIDGVHPHDVGEILNQHNIAIRAGKHCAFPYMKHLQIPGMCRASFHIYNTREDVDQLVSAVREAIKLFQ